MNSRIVFFRKSNFYFLVSSKIPNIFFVFKILKYYAGGFKMLFK